MFLYRLLHIGSNSTKTVVVLVIIIIANTEQLLCASESIIFGLRWDKLVK